MIGGHDLHRAIGMLEERPVLFGRRPQRLLDEHHVGKRVVALEQRQVGLGGGGDVGDDVAARLQLQRQGVAGRGVGCIPVEQIAVGEHRTLGIGQRLATTGLVGLHDVRAEVEKALQHEQVLIGFLAPLAEAHQHDILLDVLLLLFACMQAGIADGHGGLPGQAGGVLDLFLSEDALLLALPQDHGAEGAGFPDQQWQRHEGVDAEDTREVRGDQLVVLRIRNGHGVAAVGDLEDNRPLGPFHALLAPRLRAVGRGGAIPGGAILLQQRD